MGGFPAADDPDLPAPVLRPHRGDEPGEWAVPELAIRQVGDFPILDEAALPSLVLDQCHSHEFDPRVSQELALEDDALDAQCEVLALDPRKSHDEDQAGHAATGTAPFFAEVK